MTRDSKEFDNAPSARLPDGLNRRTFLGTVGGTAASAASVAAADGEASSTDGSKRSTTDRPAAIPHPVLDDHPEWVNLYYRAWEIADEKVQSGTPANGFVDRYLDEGFNPNIFQWDTCFMMFFAKYANGYVPSIESLDNFYRKQRPNGAICREIRESDGSDFWSSDNPSFTNPPLFAWAEWQYYQYTGDDSRFARVLPILDDYFQWCKRHRTLSNGVYWWSDLASGMDNSPRSVLANEEAGGWIDYTAQQALAARCLQQMAGVVGDDALIEAYRAEYEELTALLNNLCWNEEDGFYWDLFVEGDGTVNQTKTKTAASFWPLIAGVADDEQAAALVEHLRDINEFYRPNLFPALAADHEKYERDGGYWRGGVWVPTNLMYVKGLQRTGHEDLATEAAMNLVETMMGAYQTLDPHTIWENYAPEADLPSDPARPDFVGWSGSGPISLLIENVLGVRVNTPENKIVWRPALTERHGVRNLKLGDCTVDLIAEERHPGAAFRARIETDTAFTLVIRGREESQRYEIKPGSETIEVPAPGVARLPSDQAGIDLTFDGTQAETVRPGETVAATATFANESDRPLRNVAVGLHVPDGWAARSEDSNLGTVQPGEVAETTWEIGVPETIPEREGNAAAYLERTITGEATFDDHRTEGSRRDSVVALVSSLDASTIGAL